ncbi:MAG TPA: patatin-like phospholipase family protein [Methylomirabilota bacterium]|nr:patatin-like phospholipase family protein [Methylomirabilota bacterium]
MLPRGVAALSLLTVCALGPAPRSATAAEPACAPSSLALTAPTALVLSGGGAKGAYEAGVAAALIEGGLTIRLVAGSSAGALNAAMIADGRIERLEALWRGLTRDRVYTLRTRVLFAGLLPGWLTLLALDRAGSLFDPQPLRELIDASLDLERIRASPIRLVVITTDLARREARLFDNRSVTREALMAAAAVPGAFPSVEVDGALLVDGGLTGRAPVLEALGAGEGIERAVVVTSYAPDERGTPPTTMRRALEEAFETGMIHQIRRDVELARLKFPAVELHLLRPSEPLWLRPLDFDPDVISRALERGRADGRACLSGWATR